MITARDLIRKKGSEIFSVTGATSVQAALQIMADQNLGAVLVMDGDAVVGILSERDCARKLDLQGRAADKTQVDEIMTGKVLYVEGGQVLEECMALMNTHHIRHLPVFEEGKLIGMISVRDVLKEIIDDQKFLISHLEHYILGQRG